MRNEPDADINADVQTSANGSERDRWFNPSLSATDRLRKITAVVINAVEKHGRKRKLKEAEWLSLVNTLEPVVANLVQHHLSGGRGGIVVPRSKKVLGAKPTRYQPFSFPKPFPKWLDALGALGFARVSVGSHSGTPSQWKRTTIRAGAKLIKLIEEHKVTLDDIGDNGTAEVIVFRRGIRTPFSG